MYRFVYTSVYVYVYIYIRIYICICLYMCMHIVVFGKNKCPILCLRQKIFHFFFD